MRKYFILVLTLFYLRVSSQSVADYWYFSDHIGLHFEESQLNLLNDGQTTGFATSACRSDLSGDLLFYLQNQNVRDREHNIMPNGFGIEQNQTKIYQGPLFIPNPASSDEYYLFTANWYSNPPGFLFYSIVDKSLNNGMGDVDATRKNILVHDSITLHLTATPKCDGDGYWLLSMQTFSDKVLCYEINSSGLDTIPTEFAQSSPLFNFGFNTGGRIKVSSQGDKVALTHLGDSNLNFFSFDNTTGNLSAPFHISLGETDSVFKGPYDLEFSPSGDRLYVTIYNQHSFNQDENDNYLIQLDLSNFDSASIVNSIDTINQDSVQFWFPQLAPDGKIYLASRDSFLHIIHHPNALGQSCSLEVNGIDLNGKMTYEHLPQFPYDQLENPIGERVICFGDSADFSFNDSCLISLEWSFDDSGSIGNISNLTTVSHLFSDTGVYEVSLTVTYSSAVKTFSNFIRVVPANLPDIFPDTLVVCDSTLSSNISLVDYQWSVGATTNSIYIDSSGLYSVTITNQCDTMIDSVFAILNQRPEFFLPADTHLCQGDSLILAPQINASADLLWSDGSTDTNLIIGDWLSPDFQSQLYWLEASNACGTVRDSVLIDFIPSPDAALPPDSAHCLSSTVPIQRPDQIATTYAWHDGSDDIVFVADRSMTISLSANNVCGIATDSMNVTLHPEIKVSLGEDRLLCPEDSVVLNASWPGASYAWSPIQSTDSLISVQSIDLESGVTTPYSVTVTKTPCSATATTSLTLKDEACDSNACKFSIPNVFSPNADGINDQLNISNSCESVQFEVFIYNRWGQLVFSSGATNDARAQWDGFVNGEAAAEGTYYMIIQYDEAKIQRAIVTLMK